MPGSVIPLLPGTLMASFCQQWLPRLFESVLWRAFASPQTRSMPHTMMATGPPKHERPAPMPVILMIGKRNMTTATLASSHELTNRRSAPLATPTDLNPAASKAIVSTLNALLADVFAVYLKSKNFHWHMSGPHFRDYHLMLDEQAQELFAMTDPLAERCRKLGGPALRSIGHVSRTQRVLDNDAEYVEPMDMLAELRDDNRMLAAQMRQAHGLCNEHHDIASACLLEGWIDQSEQRIWFLFEASRMGASPGRITLAV